MALYEHLIENIVEADPKWEKACADLEEAFKHYMDKTQMDEDALVDAISPLLYDAKWALKDDIDNDIKKHYPKNQMIITQALLYCFDNHGLKAGQRVRRQDFFNIPVMGYLAKQKDYCLIREMNALREGKEEVEEREKVTCCCVEYAENNEELGKKLAAFFYLLKHPQADEDAMQGELDLIVKEIKRSNEIKEREAMAWLRTLMIEKLEADKWTFLSLVYDRYGRNQEIKYTSATMKSLGDEDRAALKKVEDTHDEMNTLTKLQAGGMLLGGFTFGIEVGMLILEEAAEEDVLEAWHVLLLSAALSMTLGRRLGLFFFRSHIYELQKQSKENYFNATYGAENESERRPISWTAVVGTGAEGLLVLFGLITSGLFTCDMTTMAIRNAMGHHDKYTTDIFGTYFWNKMTDEGEWGYLVASTVSLLLGVAAVGSAISLTCGHYALDGQETKAYEAKQNKLLAMKRVA
ncbi:MAG: hypothetical protein ACHQAX_06060 [Gammaproteobacteria bacterium]